MNNLNLQNIILLCDELKNNIFKLHEYITKLHSQFLAYQLSDSVLMYRKIKQQQKQLHLLFKKLNLMMEEFEEIYDTASINCKKPNKE